MITNHKCYRCVTVVHKYLILNFVFCYKNIFENIVYYYNHILVI